MIHWIKRENLQRELEKHGVTWFVAQNQLVFDGDITRDDWQGQLEEKNQEQMTGKRKLRRSVGTSSNRTTHEEGSS